MRRVIERILIVVLLGGIALVTCALPAVAQTASLAGPVPIAQPASSAPEYVRAGKLLDVRSGKILDDQVIVIRGERIELIPTDPAVEIGNLLRGCDQLSLARLQYADELGSFQ